MLTLEEVRDHGDRLISAHALLVDTTKEAQAATQQVLTAQATLKQGERRIINEHADDPKRLGSNEEARKARLADLLAEQHHDVLTAEMRERMAKDAQALAQLKVKALQDELRSLELLAQVDLRLVAAGG